jgi:hypothetical protein
MCVWPGPIAARAETSKAKIGTTPALQVLARLPYDATQTNHSARSQSVARFFD